MTFKEMQDDLVNQRFGENKRDQTKTWLNTRMGMIWAMAEWPFKKTDRETAAVDASGVVTMPSTFRRMNWMETADEGRIFYQTPAEFRATWGAGNADSGSAPVNYTVLNGVAYVRPHGASSVYIAYDRKMCHLANGTTLTAGIMDSDNDEPVWDEEFHHVLVSGAMSTGLKIENDPTWESLEAEFGMIVAWMREEYLPPDGAETKQFGRVADW